MLWYVAASIGSPPQVHEGLPVGGGVLALDARLEGGDPVDAGGLATANVVQLIRVYMRKLETT